jgi:hypothetical protein
MATARPFAYNTGSAIAGTEQVGSIAIGTPTSGFESTGLQWWNGPDEDLGYVIAHTVPSGTQPNPLGVPAYIGFWRTPSKTDNNFISLSQYVSSFAGTPQTFANASAAKTWLNSAGYWTSWDLSYTAGVFKTTYSGYFNDNVNFFATATPASVGGNPATSVQTTEITEPPTSDGENFSCQWLGYFKPTTTQTYTFYTSSDDASYVWIGNNTISGFTTTNSTVNNGGLHGTQERSGSIALTAGTYYPLRIQFGELSGGDVMTFSYSTPTIAKTTTVTGLIFYNLATNGF